MNSTPPLSPSKNHQYTIEDYWFRNASLNNARALIAKQEMAIPIGDERPCLPASRLRR